MLAAFFDRIIRALTPHPPPLNPATPTYPARPRTIHSRVKFFKAPPPSFDSGIPSSSSPFDFGTPSSHHYKAPPSSSSFGIPPLPQNSEVPPPPLGFGAPLPSLRFIPAVFGQNPAVNCALVLSSHVSGNTNDLPASSSPPPVATPDLRSPPDFSPPDFSPPDFSPPDSSPSDSSSSPDSSSPLNSSSPADFSSPSDLPLPNPPPVVSPNYSTSTAYVDYVCNGSPFLQFSHLSDPPPYVPGGLPPPSFAFGPAEEPEEMSEPKPHTTRSSNATPRAASEGNKDESSASEIPYFKLHTTHLSVLRGHIKYLEILNRKKGCEGKLDKMIAGYVQIIKDAKTAAAIAGIVRDDSKLNDKRKSRPSVSFAEKDEIFVSPAYKKTKAKPAPITVLKPQRGNAGKRKPTAEALATLRSCLGKRNRSTTESTSEDEEDAPLKPFKRPRPRIFQEGDPLGKYVGDPDTDDEEDEEDEDSDSDSFKSATSKSEPIPVDNPAEVISSPVAAPADTEAAKPVSSTASSVPIAEPSKPVMPASQTKRTANKPAVKKSAKKQRQASVSEDIEIDTSSSGDLLFAIRPPLPGKHTVDGEVGGQRSAKKQKQKSTPGGSTGNASASVPVAPATNAQTPTKRSASGAGAPQPNTKRNKK